MTAGSRPSPDVFNLIGRIYDSVLSKDAWPEILDRLTRVSRIHAATVFVADEREADAAVIATSTNIPLEALQEYATMWVKHDAPALERLKTWAPRELVPLGDLGGAGPAMKEWLSRRLGIRARFAVRLNDHRAWVDGMNLHLATPREELSAHQRSVLEVSIPHIARAVTIARPFHVLRARHQAVIAVLDRLHLGVIILNDQRQVIISNREAQRILSLRDGIGLGRRGCLSLPTLAEGAGIDFDRVIADAVATAAGQAGVPEQLLTVPRPSRQDPFICEVSPLTESGAEISRGFRGALVLVVDPARTDVVSIAGMEKLYGLTTAEGAVLSHLVHGRTTSEIADERDTSPETVRTQIKGLFAKTRTQTRSALVRLALTVNLPIDPVEG